MAINRLEVLQSMVAQNPADGFSRYGLAMELVKTGELEAAIEQFRELLQHNPNYSAGYFHGGQTFEKIGRLDEAKAMYAKGIEVTRATGDAHTESELQAALSMLG